MTYKRHRGISSNTLNAATAEAIAAAALAPASNLFSLLFLEIRYNGRNPLDTQHQFVTHLYFLKIPKNNLIQIPITFLNRDLNNSRKPEIRLQLYLPK